MSKKQHTPGPWTATQYGYEKFSVNGEKGVEICGAWNKANASLIAAAPELLEALEMALADADRIVCSPDEMELDWLNEARTAIAKARGEA